MISIAALVLDRAAAGLPFDLDTIPAFQREVYADELAPLFAARDAAPCRDLIKLGVPARPANALNVEVGTPVPRCRLRTPAHWNGVDPRASRWLLSGGSALVLGHCTNCKEQK